jgi:hypothetical protein
MVPTLRFHPGSAARLSAGQLFLNLEHDIVYNATGRFVRATSLSLPRLPMRTGLKRAISGRWVIARKLTLRRAS